MQLVFLGKKKKVEGCEESKGRHVQRIFQRQKPAVVTLTMITAPRTPSFTQ